MAAIIKRIIGQISVEDNTFVRQTSISSYIKSLNENQLLVNLKFVGTSFLTNLLLFSGFCSGLRLEVGSIGISLSHLLLPFLLVYLLPIFYSHKIYVYKDNTTFFLLLIWAISIVSTVIYSGFPTRSITGVINFTSFLLLFFLSQWLMELLPTEALAQKIFSSAKISTYVGIGSLLVALATHQTNIGATYDHVNQQNMGFISQAIPSIRSLSIEPNLFAIATAAVLCIFISVYLTWNKRGMLVSILLMSAALLLSYTRSAYIGIFVSVIIMAVVSKQWTVIFRVMFIGFAAAILLVLLIVFLPSDNTFKQAISYKLVSGIVDFSEGTSIPRVVALQESVKGFLHSPIIGNGIFSANNVFVNPYTGEVTGTAGPIGWLNGLFIQALHDTGILGVLAWVGFFFTLLRKNYVIFKRLPISFERSIVLGFIGGNFVILIGSQASSIVWIAFPFIFWAANLTYLRYCREKIKVLY